VPIEMASHGSLGSARTLRFCYLCGKAFGSSADRNADHVPPSTVFDDLDREPVLILSTHPDCNGAYSPQDQQIGQLVGMLHRRRFPAGQRKLAIHEIEGDDGEIRALLYGTSLPATIRRWVRGFHAALYREYLPEREGSFKTFPPLTAVDGTGTTVSPRPQELIAPRLESALRQARAQGQLDRIEIRNGKCRYQCVWAPWTATEWCCVYQLDLYNWSDLGDPRLPQTNCVGIYRAVGAEPPRGAATISGVPA
jgi:hypothetical protein